MAFVSLFSCPPNPVLDHNTELAGDEREDGELEDGEIDDEGIGIEEEKETKVETEGSEKVKEKEKVREKEDRTHRHAHKRHRKIKEKHKSKRRRRERLKHHSPDSGSGSDSYNTDHEQQERHKSRKSKSSYRDYDGRFAQRELEPSAGHGKAARSSQRKTSESEEKYDYDEDQDDFCEELSKYKQAKEVTTSSKAGSSKEQGTKSAMKGPQFGGPRGRGRGGGSLGRGRGVLNKNKKLKGKSWGRGRGRGGEPGESGGGTKGEGQQCFQKKRPIMSQEFINQHTIEHNGRNICKYFIEGRCIKGDQCKFEHDNVVPEKKKELCKFYVQGYCTKGENCIYMHNEYPCKFFHTGAKCYQGDHCKFSHDPLTDVTKELLEKVLNTDEEHVDEEEQELEILRKQGIVPLPKPPPGVGLLPTPGSGSPQDGSKKIPSLFEIKVQPTVDLAQKIALRPNFYNSTSPPSGQFPEGSAQEDMETENMVSPGHSHSLLPPPGSPGSMGGPTVHFPGQNLPQSPPTQAPPQGFGHSIPMPPPGLQGQSPVFHQNTNSQMNQQGAQFKSLTGGQMNAPFQAMSQMPTEFFKSLFSVQPLALAEEGQSGSLDPQHLQGSSSESHGGMKNILPAVQKALLRHLNHNQQDSDSHRAEGQDIPLSRDRDETTNWYSSDDEDGSSVTAILKTLKKQNEMLQTQQSQQANLQQSGVSATPLTDPRLYKERALVDPRQHVPDTRREAETVLDPRLARDSHKPKPVEPSNSKVVSHHPHTITARASKPSAGEEDDEGERELRERAVLIPPDPSPGALLRDPRCQIKQFSHIRVDILLQRPAFAQSVVWAPEDLIPLLIPKQEPSINLPLPPLIADAQLNRNLSTTLDHSSSAPPPPDPRLAAARLREDVDALGIPHGRTRVNTEKPTDPRTHKAGDARVNRSGSLDSKMPIKRECSSGAGVSDPRLQRGAPRQSATSARSDSEKLPPYAPRVASSTGSGLENPTTLLGGISLYDPRNHTLLSPRREREEPLKNAGILKQTVITETPTPPQVPSPSVVMEKKSEDTFVSENQTNGSQPGQTMPAAMAAPSCSPARAAAPAMHNLPIQQLAGLMRPAYTDTRQNRPTGQIAGAPEEDQEDDKEEEKKDRPLRDVFKTFDPTASPFCQ